MTAGRSGRPERDRSQRVGLQRPPGPRVELVQGVRGEADEERAGERSASRAGRRAGCRAASARRSSARPARCAAKAALGAAEEVVREADRGDGGDLRLEHADRSSRRAGGAGRGGSSPSGPNASTMSRAGGRGAGTRARSRPVARWRSGSSTSSTVEPCPQRVDRHPRLARRIRPRAGSTGRAAAADSSALAGERLAQLAPGGERGGARGRCAWRSRSRRPAARAKAATARSASESSSGRRSPARSASQSSSGPGGAFRSARVSACPLPAAREPEDRAPAASASAAVPSREPSSATITSRRGRLAQRRDRRADPRPPRRGRRRGSVSRLSHRQPGDGGIGGRTPSPAVFFTP